MTDVLFSPTMAFATDLANDHRLAASVSRLGREDYATSAVIAEGSASDWPGDVAGRLLLTTSRFAAAGHGDADRVTELFEAILKALAPHGYFGQQFTEFIDEQQVASHGWVVSGLLQYGIVFADNRALVAAERVVDRLILPAVDALDRYPRERTLVETGDPFGGVVRVEHGWRLSSDTWCVMLSLNALVPLFEATGGVDVRAAIDRLVGVLGGIDLVAQRAQLHASLAAARNVARFGELTGDPRSVALAARIYEQYVVHGRTLNYATYNWFGRPNSWTEPCAIVDSLGLALCLWRITADAAYLRDVTRIEHSALGFAERLDGSFGLDTVATAQSPTISPFHSDARWCCTMRGGLGLVDVRDRSFLFDGDELVIVLPRSGTLRLSVEGGQDWRIRAVTSYPAGGTVELTVESVTAGAAPLQVRMAHSGATGLVEARVGASLSVIVDAGDAVVALEGGRELRFRGPELMVAVEGRGMQPLSSLPRGMTDPPNVYRLDHDAPTDPLQPG